MTSTTHCIYPTLRVQRQRCAPDVERSDDESDPTSSEATMRATDVERSADTKSELSVIGR
jgi:hypothetical protein